MSATPGTPCASEPPPPTIGATHYAECWREHHACATARIERFEAVLRGVASCERSVSACVGEADIQLFPTADAGGAFLALLRELRAAR